MFSELALTVGQVMLVDQQIFPRNWDESSQFVKWHRSMQNRQNATKSLCQQVKETNFETNKLFFCRISM